MKRDPPHFVEIYAILSVEGHAPSCPNNFFTRSQSRGWIFGDGTRLRPRATASSPHPVQSGLGALAELGQAGRLQQRLRY